MVAIVLLTMVGTSAFAQTKEITLNSTPWKITVRSGIEVEVISSPTNKMEVTAKAKLLERFYYSFDGGHLKLELQKKKFFESFDDDIKVKLYVTDIDKIENIRMSGGSEMTLKYVGTLSVKYVELSGASELELQGNVSHLTAKLSGASDMEYTGNALTMNVRLSGASDCSLRGNYRNVISCLSGASSLDMASRISESLSADLSGASELTYKGSTQNAIIVASGASSFDGKKCTAETAELKASGASNIDINAKQVLKCNSSGASSINF